MAYRARWSTMASSSDSMTTWLRALSRVPISGTATVPSHSLITGVATSSSCCRCRSISSAFASSAVSMTTRRSVPSSRVRASTLSWACAAVASGNSSRSNSTAGMRSPATSSAIWDGVEPLRVLVCVMRPNWSRTGRKPGAVMSSRRPLTATSDRESTTALHASTASSRETVKTERNNGASAQRWAICSRRRSRKELTTRGADPVASCSGTLILSFRTPGARRLSAGSEPIIAVRQR